MNFPKIIGVGLLILLVLPSQAFAQTYNLDLQTNSYDTTDYIDIGLFTNMNEHFNILLPDNAESVKINFSPDLSVNLGSTAFSIFDDGNKLASYTAPTVGLFQTYSYTVDPVTNTENLYAKLSGNTLLSAFIYSVSAEIVSYKAISAVPEPSIFIQLLLGFGLIFGFVYFNNVRAKQQLVA